MQFSDYDNCTLCPRDCGANRSAGKTGFCGVTGKLKAARAALHFWEEPCISGTNGSGAVFFSGCNLHCVFCQNEAISRGKTGLEIPPERLAEIFLELQEKHANNINLVTACQYLPHVIFAVEEARRQGMHLPIVYNTSGYEKVDQLKRLEGIVDVYLPDFKYRNPLIARKYSMAQDYPEVAKAALAEMVRQQPLARFYPENKLMETEESGAFSDEAEDGLLIRNGVIVRQLLLPGQRKDAKAIVRYLHETYGNQIYISMMSQFTPMPNVENYPELNCKISSADYENYIDFAMRIGVEHGFVQGGDVAEESFIPEFDCEGIRKEDNCKGDGYRALSEIYKKR